MNADSSENLLRTSTHKRLEQIILNKPYKEAMEMIHDLKHSGEGKSGKSPKSEKLNILVGAIEALVQQKEQDRQKNKNFLKNFKESTKNLFKK